MLCILVVDIMTICTTWQFETILLNLVILTNVVAHQFNIFMLWDLRKFAYELSLLFMKNGSCIYIDIVPL